jgi:hypothetical protein
MRFDVMGADGTLPGGQLTDGVAFRLARLVCEEDGHSAFIDEHVPFDEELLSPPAAPLELAPLGPASSVSVMRADSNWAGGALHPAPRRQLLTVIAGGWRVTTSRGEHRTFGVGDCFVVEDVVGRGHRSLALSDASMAVVIALGPVAAR